jgi:hypothetical protein
MEKRIESWLLSRPALRVFVIPAGLNAIFLPKKKIDSGIGTERRLGTSISCMEDTRVCGLNNSH